MQLSVFLCMLCVYGDVWSGQVSDATICISVCMVMSGLVRSLMQLSVFLCVLCVW